MTILILSGRWDACSVKNVFSEATYRHVCMRMFAEIIMEQKIYVNRHSRRQVLREVILCSASFEECFCLFHSTMLEDVRARLGCSVAKKNSLQTKSCSIKLFQRKFIYWKRKKGNVFLFHFHTSSYVLHVSQLLHQIGCEMSEYHLDKEPDRLVDEYRDNYR